MHVEHIEPRFSRECRERKPGAAFQPRLLRVNASLRVIKAGLRGLEGRRWSSRGNVRGEDVEKRTRSLTHLSRPQSTVQDKSLDVMLLLTNGIARNSALSYEHVRDSFLSLSLSLSPVVVVASFVIPLRPSLLFLIAIRDLRASTPIYRSISLFLLLSLPLLALYLSISTSRNACSCGATT